MSTAAPQPAVGFLTTGRGGHSADPNARCPACGEPAGTHQGVDLTPPKSWFPMRIALCAPAAPAAAGKQA